MVCTFADANGDGIPDLAVADLGTPTLSGGVSTLLQDVANRGSFLQSDKYAAGIGPQDVAVGDLNGDGKLDIAAADGPTATIMFQKPTGHGKFLQLKVVGR